MEMQKKLRSGIRANVTRTITALETELGAANPDLDGLRDRKERLLELKDELKNYDGQIVHMICTEANPDPNPDADADAEVFEDAEEQNEDLNKEMDAQENYRRKINLAVFKIERFLKPARETPSSDVPQNTSSSPAPSETKKRTYKLPEVALKHFSGDVMEWLSWWNQFQRIHEDEDLHNSDKFQYLIQTIVEKSKAEDLIKAYPQTSENYPKAIQALKERFGDENILKRVYIRELLQLVIKNSRGGVSLSSTYDKLEAHLKALQSLGITPDQMDIILFPMVESCLPEDILIAWQRSPQFGRADKKANPPVTEFDYLLEFIKSEVKNLGQREMARQVFGVSSHKKEPLHVYSRSSKGGVPTAASLVTSSDKALCILCEKSHLSRSCFKIKKMNYEQRRQLLQTNGGCFKCMQKGHQSQACPEVFTCSHCSKSHLTILCPIKDANKENRHSQSSSSGTVALSGASNSISSLLGDMILMKTIIVRIRGSNGRTKEARLLYDEGSQYSFIKETLMRDVGCRHLGTVRLQNNLYGGITTGSKNYNVFQVDLEGLFNNKRKRLNLLGDNVLCKSVPSIPDGPWLEELTKRNIKLTDTTINSPEAEILIGSNLWGKLMKGAIKSLNCGLTLVNSIFGWTLSGEVPHQVNTNYANSTITMMVQGEKTIQEMWSLEALGIRDKAEQITREEHEYEVKKKFQDSITRALDGRYIVELPWAEQSSSLPSNKVVAEKRLLRATEKLKREEEFDNYDKIFRSWEEENIIEVCVHSCEEGHFLPHRPVFKPSSITTPVRPVFDASCKVGKYPSLNQCLEKGPNMLELIPAILLRFRQKKIGVTADIRKAFQMIGVAEKDKNFQKFLWWEDQTCQKLKIYKHCRVVFGLNCSPFILAAVIDLHLQQIKETNQSEVDRLKKSLYVDNVVTSFDEEEEYIEFKKKSISIFDEAKMELRQWEDNIRVLETSPVVSVLGLAWNKYEDTMSVQIPEVIIEGPVTKRSVLSIVSKVFDPIGFTCPAVIYPKVMLQDSWSTSMDWDKEWDVESSNKFLNWAQELPVLKTMKIPRLAFGINMRTLTELHVFCDASKSAYAAVVFVRTEDSNNVNVQLLSAKSRLAPLDKKKKKSVTIPRLELMGCLIGSRLLQAVQESLSLGEVPIILWSDSSTALAWIKREEDWGTFVGNRVREINKITKARDWRHVPGHLNPADLPSRGCTPSQLLASTWWEGPSWLKLSKAEWPSQPEKPDEEEILREKKKTAVCTAVMRKRTTPRFSSYLQNVRVFGWIRRFICNSRVTPERRNTSKYLSFDEMKTAERHLIKSIQEDHSTNLMSLKNLKTVSFKGLIYVHSRVNIRESAAVLRNPLVLPKDDPIVHQLIEHVHRSHCHAGVQFVLGKLREKYWIISGRKTVARVIHKCVVCRRHVVKKMSCEPGPLPFERTHIQAAFQTTGVDLAGPILLKGGKKVWIVIYTCAVYRGVYFDVINSISTDEFLLSLQQFTYIFGRPNHIFSDNGTNFVGASNLLRNKKLEETQLERINWSFNPPTAAWWGGWWERLIRTLKDLLRKMIGNAKLTLKDLERCLVSISYTINNRPLTTLTEDPDDLSPLTPAMFMRDLPLSGLPEVDQITPKHLQESYQRIQTLRSSLQNRFRKEYLSQLVQKRNEGSTEQLKVGDVVLVGFDNKKRYEWPLGRVLEVFPGKDTKIRVARIKTARGELIRPIQRLYPLEITEPSSVPVPVPVEKDNQISVYSEETETPSPVVIKTRGGRIVRPPVRFTSWNK